MPSGLIRRQAGDTHLLLDYDDGRWAFASGPAFPTAGSALPPPHDGAVFFRIDLAAYYVWDEGTATWTVLGGGAAAHAASHQNGGEDEISVAGLSGLLADAQTPLSHAASHQNGGADEISVVGLSGLLADSQTPLTHASSHQSGGSDAIKLDDLAAPDDNTDLDASTTKHGLLKKLDGNTSNFLRGDGAWAAPAAAPAPDQDARILALMGL